MNPVIRHALLGVMAVATLCAVAAAGYYRSARRLREAQDSAREAPTAVTPQAHGLSATAVEQGSAAEEAEELLRLREKERAWTAELNRREEAVRQGVRQLRNGGAKPSEPDSAPLKPQRVTLAELRERDPKAYAYVRRVFEERRKWGAQNVELRRKIIQELNPAYLPEEEFRQLKSFLEDLQRYEEGAVEGEERRKLEQETLNPGQMQAMKLAQRYHYAQQGRNVEEMTQRARQYSGVSVSPYWYPAFSANFTQEAE